MKTPTMLLLAAVFAAVSLAPQAMAQSCDAKRPDFNNWFRTQRNDPGTYWISPSTPMNRANDLYVGDSDDVGDHAALKTTLPGFSAKLSLASLRTSYLTGRSPQASVRPVSPQFNWWCYLICIQNGGNSDDCRFMCNGLPRPQ